MTLSCGRVLTIKEKSTVCEEGASSASGSDKAAAGSHTIEIEIETKEDLPQEIGADLPVEPMDHPAYTES